MNTKVQIGKAFSDAFAIFKQNALLLIVSMLLVTIVGSATSGICSGCLYMGFFAICLRLIDGDAQKPDIGDVFKGFSFFVPGFVLFYLLAPLGFLVCCIGILITVPVSFWAAMRIVDVPTMPLGDAIKEAFDLIFKKKMWGLVWLQIVAMLFMGVGILLCCVGVFITIPLGFLVLACAYRQVYPKA